MRTTTQTAPQPLAMRLAALATTAVLLLIFAASAAWSADRPSPAEKPSQTQQVLASDVEALIADGLVQEGAADKVAAMLDGRGASTLYNGKGQLSIALTALDFNAQEQNFKATVIIYEDDKEAKTLSLSGRFEPLTDIPVLAHQLRRGDVIDTADIAWISIPDQKLRKDTITSQQDLIGFSARRSMAAHRPIRRTDIEQPRLVSKGDGMQLIYKTPSMEIRTLATALEDGTAGQTIRLRNNDSNAVIHATITGKGTAEVAALTQLSSNQ